MVHSSVSPHSASVLQQFATGSCTQPVASLQESVVQALPSSQFGAAPPAQLPPLHVSGVVHALPSSHGSVLLRCVHPVAGLQPSSVQTLPSLQSSAGPPWQLPPLQVSAVVQALLSLQGSVLLTCVHPVAGLQPSSVQTLPSLQFGGGPPTQLPPLQVSLVVQALSSSHGLVLLVCAHPVAGLHVSLVQTLLSLQSVGGPPTQLPPLQVSFDVHALLSLQGSLLLVWVQPVAGLQASSVQALLSSQLGGAPPVQTPFRQTSFDVHALLSLHSVLFGWKPSAGHAFDVPSHVSATSHWPVEARHGVPADFTASAGQFGPLPSHESARSQTSLALRHTPL